MGCSISEGAQLRHGPGEGTPCNCRASALHSWLYRDPHPRSDQQQWSCTLTTNVPSSSTLRAQRLLYAEHSGSRHCPVPFAMQHTSRPAAELLISPGTSAAYAKPSGEIQRIWGTSGREQEFPFVGLQGSAGTHYTSVSREAKTAEPGEVSRQHGEGLVQTAVQMGNTHDQPHEPCMSKRML